jgi:hypothetical protein
VLAAILLGVAPSRPSPGQPFPLRREGEERVDKGLAHGIGQLHHQVEALRGDAAIASASLRTEACCSIR